MIQNLNVLQEKHLIAKEKVWIICVSNLTRKFYKKVTVSFFFFVEKRFVPKFGTCYFL